MTGFGSWRPSSPTAARQVRALAGLSLWALRGALSSVSILVLSSVLLGALSAPASEAPGRWVMVADSPATVRARVAALLLSDRDGGTFPMEVLVLPGSGAGEAGKLTVMIELPGFEALREGAVQGLEEASELGSSGVEAFVYALTADDSVVVQATLASALTEIPPAAAATGFGLKVFTALRLDPGVYRLRVLVRVGPEAFAVRTAEVSVPTEPHHVLGPPQVDARGPWLALVGPLRKEARSPVSHEVGLDLLPMAVVDLKGGEVFEIRLPVPSALGEISTLEARFVASPSASRSHRGEGSQGHEIGEAWQGLSDGSWRLSAGATPGAASLEAEISVPNLPPGPYVLSLRLNPPVGTSWESAPLSVRVAASGPSPRPRAQTARRRVAGREASPRSGKGLQRAYLQILEVLAGQGKDPALALLEPLFEGGEGEGTEEAQVLTEALATVLTSRPGNTLANAGGSWAGVLPIIEMHLGLVEKALEGQRYSIARGATTLTWALAQGRAQALSAAEDQTLSALIMTCLGELHGRFGGTHLAEEFFSAATTLDPTLASATLQHAVLLERKGEYSASARVIEGLLRHRPEDREGRLRLALVQLRLGRSSVGRRGLEALVREEPSDWIRLVAVQELARALGDRREATRRREVLELGATLWPRNLALATLQALDLDGQAQYAEARALLASFEGLPRESAMPERLRYSSGPGFDGRALQKRLEGAAVLEVPALKSRFLNEDSR